MKKHIKLLMMILATSSILVGCYQEKYEIPTENNKIIEEKKEIKALNYTESEILMHRAYLIDLEKLNLLYGDNLDPSYPINGYFKNILNKIEIKDGVYGGVLAFPVTGKFLNSISKEDLRMLLISKYIDQLLEEKIVSENSFSQETKEEVERNSFYMEFLDKIHDKELENLKNNSKVFDPRFNYLKTSLKYNQKIEDLVVEKMLKLSPVDCKNDKFKFNNNGGVFLSIYDVERFQEGLGENIRINSCLVSAITETYGREKIEDLIELSVNEAINNDWS